MTMPESFVQIPPGWKHPDKTLIIAASERTGTEMLCRLVDSTGLFKRTTEAFNDQAYREVGIEAYTMAEMLAAIDTLSRSDKNLIGLKVFWHHMVEVERLGLLDHAFPDSLYVFLRREDILGQAISFVRARQTNEWTYGEDRSSNYYYDEAAITKAIYDFAQANAWWEFFFATRKVDVLRLTYEQLDADPMGVTADIVKRLGFDPHPANPDAFSLFKQRDALSEKWRQMYVASYRRPLPGIYGDAA